MLENVADDAFGVFERARLQVVVLGLNAREPFLYILSGIDNLHFVSLLQHHVSAFFGRAGDPVDTLGQRQCAVGLDLYEEACRMEAWMTEKYGKGFSMRNLYNFVLFYQTHPNIFYAVTGKSEILPSAAGQSENILQSLTAKSPSEVQSVILLFLLMIQTFIKDL